MEKQETEGTINSKSQNKTKIRFPVVPKHFDGAERQKIEENGRGRSVLLYTLAHQRLEYIIKTCNQLEVYDEHVVDTLWLACEELGVIRNDIINDAVSFHVPDGDDETDDKIEKEIRKFENFNDIRKSLSKLVEDELVYIRETHKQLEVREKLVIDKLDAICHIFPIPNDGTGNDIKKKLQSFKICIKKMRVRIRPQFDAKELGKRLKDLTKSATKSAEYIVTLPKQMPSLHSDPTFEKTLAFGDFEVQYNDLPPNLKLCLLCFSVFPSETIIKKRLMIYWWIAEGFIEKEKDNIKDLEQLGAEYFDKLIKKNFIKPYHNKRRLEVETCKMPSFICSALLYIATRAKFFDFNSIGRPKADCPSSFRSALLAGQHGLESKFDFEKFHVVFNVSEANLDIRPEWINRMKNVVVLYLGRWTGNHNIEVDDEKFLKALSDMKHLRLLSLQGILRITELPDEVTKLNNLTILDLRACHHLEKIPRDIGLLMSLTHLDLSECYFLERIPKGLSKLKNLLVLKGFAVVEPSKNWCSLGDLSKLPKLRKLSIITGLKEFPGEDDFKAFQQFEVLTKLKIVWGGGVKKEDNRSSKLPKQKKSKCIWSTSTPENGNNNADSASHSLPHTLQKLDLECFPKNKPLWLHPMKLMNLEKLYIRGGQLCDLNTWFRSIDPWRVKILRLKYLTGLAMHWKEVDKLFPELIYLEIVKCPKLTFFPCDTAGVWIDKDRVAKLELTIC